MERNTFEKKEAIGNRNNSHLIQAAVICLAGVSLFTTAQGMTKYIFNNDAIAYISSAAIQGVLLAMSMGLPSYVQGVFKNQWKLFFKCLVSGFIIVLTIIAMCCSSWFSYIYIAEVVHFESWEIDSELLVQQTYRAELYDAKDYAYAYRVYLEDSLGKKILDLEAIAEELALNESLETLDEEYWENEKKYYEEMGNLTGSYMMPVIDTMKNALDNNSTQSSREQAARAIEDAKSNIEDRKGIVEQRLEDINKNIENFNTRISSLTNQMNRVTEGTDISDLQAAWNNMVQLLEMETDNQNELLMEYDLLNGGISKLQIYETYLGLNESTSSITIKSQLLEMQTEFFAEDPDEEALVDTAETIFKNLRNAATYEERDKMSYSNLLVQMNQLILNLKDYSRIKEIESELELYIEQFASEDKSMAADDWKDIWHIRLENLKSVISAMPVYNVRDTSENGESAVTELQHEILTKYNRNESSSQLDEMIRLYIAKHNALYQGIIYLRSPYNGLAWFSLILAFSFDVSGFIFGFVNQGDVDKEDTKRDNEKERKNKYGRKKDKASWSILPTLNKYRILTGDYEKNDDVYSYHVFESGLLEKWDVKDSVSYEQGIYVQDLSVESKGTKVQRIEQKILFRGQPNGPQDGICLDCSLKFNEGSLMSVEEQNGKKKENFLANLYEYVPVHIYSCSRGECRTIPVHELKKDNFTVQMAVLALNDKGSRIAAIYIVEE